MPTELIPFDRELPRVFGKVGRVAVERQTMVHVMIEVNNEKERERERVRERQRKGSSRRILV